MYSDIITFLKQGAIVVTPNSRLATDIIQQYFFTSEQTVIEKPACYSYAVFLEKLFQNCIDNHPTTSPPLLLTAQQIHFLWADIIGQQAEFSGNSGLIDEVQEAWSRCWRWGIDFKDVSFSYTPQTQQFQTWVEQFHQRLHELSAITPEQIVDFLISHASIYLSQTIVWHCFDDFSPNQLKLQAHFESLGLCNAIVDLQPRQTETLLCAANDDDHEREQVLAWIKQQLAEHKQKIGLIVPNLQDQGIALRRFFQRYLPETYINMSLGQSLLERPLVEHALQWLSLDKTALTNLQARLLLSSPYLEGSQQEMLGRAQCLETSKSLRNTSINFEDFNAELCSFSPQLAERLTMLDDYPGDASLTDWVSFFANRLNQLGFPGDYLLDSDNYQSYQRLLLLFDEFKTLRIIQPMMSRSAALASFKFLAKSTIFQPKSLQTSVHVLGLLEAAGCHFDALWVTHMTDECLPQKVNLSAFIPIHIQKNHLMPRADTARELTLACKSVTRIIHSSPTCIFSYPKLSKDKPNLPSPLVQHFSILDAKSIHQSPTTLRLENYTDNQLIPCRPHEDIHGGSALLAYQAQCPFKAFAAHRLHARKNADPMDGFDHLERGQLVHKVMELLWQALTDQQTLLSLPTRELDNLIDQTIQTALDSLERVAKAHTLFKGVELIRLKRLVYALLAWEKQRPAFKVSALEQKSALELAGLPIQLRIDRMDTSEDGKQWIIDYKTSIPTSLPWREERPKEPQLLLYALLDNAINTLLFTGLKEGKLTCKGISENTLELDGVTSLKKDETWKSLTDNWRVQLNSLAEEFTQGECQPKPLNASLCQQCDFQSLCRFEQTVVDEYLFTTF